MKQKSRFVRAFLFHVTFIPYVVYHGLSRGYDGSHHHECELWARSPIRERHIRWQIWHSKLLVDGGPIPKCVVLWTLLYSWLACETPTSSVHRECFQFRGCDATLSHCAL